jgi:glycerophosphoryl diester phosphodiesterase
MSGFFVWAHRGASARAPENTLVAFRAAEAAGADGIELDVHLSADGVPVVIHDATLERTTSGRGAVGDRSAAQLQQLDAGSRFSPAFAGERLPTLEEVFVWAGDRLRLNVEIKDAAAGRAVPELLSRYPAVRALVSSFDHDLLEALRARNRDLPLAFLVDRRFWRGAVARAAACRAESLHPRQDLVSPALLAACRAAGLAVAPWTVDDPQRALRLRELGCAGLFTNDPGRILRALRP